ncbi:unnamed protein product [Cuscuta campestris]|uniref:C2 NT-type domain-containing protein n=1 Tax=Cuscuta campestris TaxID=132261 RepID=A0A484NGT1_9ASTE|nr:unnamed protein product [Cuscuta campestris]
MSRVTKWKLDKNKVKVVFRLQFHATHIPQNGWDKLFVSFIAADTGKTTAKTTKANVRNGTCKWADPIYETTRLLQDVKSKEYDEKLYKLVVAMGSSRASILGEASINLAEHVDTSKPSIVALPLLGSDTGTILHVTVQLLTSKTGFREFEQQRELSERGLQSGVDNKPDYKGPGKVSVSKDAARDEMEKVTRKTKFRPDAKELWSVEEVEEPGDLTAGFDGSSNTSESFNAEKNDTSSAHEIDSLKSEAFGDSNEPLHCQSPQQRQTNSYESQALAHGSNDSFHGWGSDCSMGNDLAIARDDSNQIRASLELEESNIFELKIEVSSIQRQADELGIATDKFAHLLAAEISSGEELAKEVHVLKLECLKAKDDIERLQNLQITPHCTEKQNCPLIQETQDKWIKRILLLEERLTDFQKKLNLGFHEREQRFLQSEFEAVLQILHDIKLGSMDEISLLNIAPHINADAKELRNSCLQKAQHSLPGLGLDLDLCPPEDILHQFSMPALVSQGPNFDLIRELDEAKFERETLVKKMNQMECYYEALVQELEENQKQMLTELQSLRNEHSTCMYTLSINEAELDSLRQDMHLQIAQLVDENHNLDAINKELGERAASSEAALRRARMNYSIAVEKLQKDLELLSSQVVSMFQSNENLIKQAFLEPSVADDLEYINGLQNLERYDATKQFQLYNENLNSRKQAACGDVFLEDLKKSLCLQEALYVKVEEDLNEMHSVNFFLDIYSKTLVESLLEADHKYALMKKYMSELAQHLKFSNECKDQLMAKLQYALEDISFFKEEKVRCLDKCNELVLQNQTLVDKLEMISEENCLLTKKLMDGERISAEYGNCLCKYESCLQQNAKLSNLLEQGILENDKLHTEISVLKEDLRLVESERDELAKSKEILQENASFMQDKLVNLLESNDHQLIGTHLGRSNHLDLDLNNLKGLLVQVEEIQHKSFSKVIQLMEENKRIEIEKHDSEVSLSRASSEILALKERFKINMQDLSTKLSTSNALVEKLQLGLESVANKLQFTAEMDENHALQNIVLGDLSFRKVELQRNEYFFQDKLNLDYVVDEIERSSSTIARLLQENYDLMMTLQSKTDESIKLAYDICGLQENLKSQSHELDSERDAKAALLVKVQDLDSQLNEKHDILLDLRQHNSELMQENHDLTTSLQGNIEDSFRLSSEASDLKEKLANLHDELHSEINANALLQAKVHDLMHTLEEKNNSLHNLEKHNNEVVQEKQELMISLQGTIEESVKLGSEISDLKEKLKSLHDELQSEKASKEGRVQDLTTELHEKHNCLLELEKCNTKLIQEKHNLVLSLQGATEESANLGSEISCLKENMRALHDALLSERDSKAKLEDTTRDLTFQLNEKHGSLNAMEMQNIHLIQERQDLTDSLKGKTEESVKLSSEIISLKDKFRSLSDELDSQKDSNAELEGRVRDLTSELNVKHLNILDLEKLNTELAHFRERASELEVEKSQLQYHLLQRDECIEKLKEDSSLLNEMRSLVQKLELSDGCLGNLREQYDDLQAKLNPDFANEANHCDEKLKLLSSLDTVRSDLEASLAQNKVLSDYNNALESRVKEYKNEVTNLEVCLSKAKHSRALEIGHLKDLLTIAEEEICCLIVSKEELGVVVTVLRSKLDEQLPYMSLLEKYQDELLTLQSQFNELEHKLAQQVLKTEEFKNLSLHLKEQKAKAEAECVLAREEKESQGPPVPKPESLRIAFIKEQYETKVQELKQQLSMSKRHGEDMLLKLQDAIDENEGRKRSDALHTKRNEELALKLSALESELQSVLYEKREIAKAHDRIKAELDCALLSLECSKEEQEKLEASLQEYKGEYSRHARDGSTTKHQLEIFKCQSTSKEVKHATDEYPKSLSPNSSHQEYLGCPEKLDACSTPAGESEDLALLDISQTAQVVLSVEGKLDSQHLSIEELPSTSYDVNSNLFEIQNLRASLDHLHAELERMKNENSLVPKDHNFHPDFQASQRELEQLRKTNEDLRSMFPLFNEITTSGNALERVLALEVELAEALKEKSESNIIHSSFFKQHSDEEAIFKSFRDINVVIKEMLELKARHAAMENELNDMHGRYSQLSLQFAEVEGERQKLKMTLKNLRGSRKLYQLSHSSSTTIPADSFSS